VLQVGQCVAMVIRFIRSIRDKTIDYVDWNIVINNVLYDVLYVHDTPTKSPRRKMVSVRHVKNGHDLDHIAFQSASKVNAIYWCTWSEIKYGCTSSTTAV